MKSALRSLVVVMALTVAAVGCTPPLRVMTPTPAAEVHLADGRLANPASVNCADLGGALQIERRPDGGEYGVCSFADDMQCEEWALLREECPAGGVKVTGSLTPAARYCVITGGAYRSAGEEDMEEQGTCTLTSGTVCDAYAFYSGICSGQ